MVISRISIYRVNLCQWCKMILYSITNQIIIYKIATNKKVKQHSGKKDDVFFYFDDEGSVCTLPHIGQRLVFRDDIFGI